MVLTAEQRSAKRSLKRLVDASGVRYRVIDDPEGWPIVPGRYGRVEWSDHRVLAVFSDAGGTIRRRLTELPGAQRWQMGDDEVRILVPHSSLRAACEVIKARRRRSAASAERLRRPA